MEFHPLAVQGACVVVPEPKGDDRGFFARIFCSETFADAGLADRFVQANNSLTRWRGTLRGLHYQLPPHEEAKLIRCIAGALYDVVLDMRPASATFGVWDAARIDAENRRQVYVPAGCAHGFMSLSDETEVLYFVSAAYAPDHERGVRWDDPRFGIAWPGEPAVISDKDRAHPNFDPAWHLPGS